MSAAPVPPAAPRSFDRAAALWLASESDFPDHFRRDYALQSWRRRTADGRWLKVQDLAEVLVEVTLRLERVLAAPDIPFVMRAVYAPLSDGDRERWAARTPGLYEVVGRGPEPVLTVADLEACDSWQGARALLAEKYLDARYNPDEAFRAPLVGAHQRHGLLRDASSQRKAYDVLRAASGLPPLRYSPQDAPVEVDPRRWLAALPRDPAAVVLSSSLYAAYRDALPDGARPLHERPFHALAVEVLGNGDEATCRTRRKGRRYYLGLSLPASAVPA